MILNTIGDTFKFYVVLKVNYICQILNDSGIPGNPTYFRLQWMILTLKEENKKADQRVGDYSCKIGIRPKTPMKNVYL